MLWQSFAPEEKFRFSGSRIVRRLLGFSPVKALIKRASFQKARVRTAIHHPPISHYRDVVCLDHG
jgi:hypothetical protein